MGQSGPSSQTLSSRPTSLSASTAAETQASIDYLYDLLEQRVSKKKIKNGLEAAGGDRDIAFDFLFGSSFAGGEGEDKDEDDEAEQMKIQEYHEDINGIVDPTVRREINEITSICPSESMKHILNMYRHFHKNKNETISALVDGYIIPNEKFGKKIKEEYTGKGKGKEAATSKTIKSEPSEYFSNNPFASHRDTSSEVDFRIRYTTPSSSSRSTPQRALPTRSARSAEWSFDGLPPLPESPKIVGRGVKTNNDGFDLIYNSDVEMLPVKNEAEVDEDDDIYGLPAEDKATGSRKTAASISSSSDDEDEDEDVIMSPPKDDLITESDLEDEIDDDDDDDIEISTDAGNLKTKKAARSTNLSRDDSEEDVEDEVELTQEEKEAHLLSLFPKAGIDAVRRELQLNQGQMTETAADLEDQYGLGGSSGPDRSVSPGVGPSRPRLPESRKRAACTAVGLGMSLTSDFD